MDRKLEITEWLKNLQNEICSDLEKLDGLQKFKEDIWTREGGGGGRTRLIEDGENFEKGGVNFSAVFGNTPEFLLKDFVNTNMIAPQFFASGISIVIHPQNPWVPIIHMNIRYFEMDNGTYWFGGGIDLTPHYFDETDCAFFHEELKKVCTLHHPQFYTKFSKWADSYFYLPHRKETRGIGGIFFDHLKADNEISFEKLLLFWKDVGKSFSPIYSKLVNANKNKIFGEKEKQWQLIRRGRYVEFNLAYDKGTKFGLETNGRVESILMSLPKNASWLYNFQPEANSLEETTLKFLQRDLSAN